MVDGERSAKAPPLKIHGRRPTNLELCQSGVKVKTVLPIHNGNLFCSHFHRWQDRDALIERLPRSTPRLGLLALFCRFEAGLAAPGSASSFLKLNTEPGGGEGGAFSPLNGPARSAKSKPCNVASGLMLRLFLIIFFISIQSVPLRFLCQSSARESRNSPSGSGPIISIRREAGAISVSCCPRPSRTLPRPALDILSSNYHLAAR